MSRSEGNAVEEDSVATATGPWVPKGRTVSEGSQRIGGGGKGETGYRGFFKFVLISGVATNRHVDEPPYDIAIWRGGVERDEVVRPKVPDREVESAHAQGFDRGGSGEEKEGRPQPFPQVATQRDPKAARALLITEH